MQQEPTRVDDGIGLGNDRLDDARLDNGHASTTTVRRRSVGFDPDIGVGENELEVKNLVQWGPILAGLLTTLGAMIVLTVLGIAIGASVLDGDVSASDLGTGAGIWGAVSAIAAFLVGGWVAAKSAAVAGPGTGLLNGLMVGLAALALVLWLTGSGLGNLFGAIGANVGDIADVAQDQAAAQGQTAQAADAEEALRGSFDEVRDGAWGTLAGIALPLAAAALGGYLGHNKRRDLIEGTR